MRWKVQSLVAAGLWAAVGAAEGQEPPSAPPMDGSPVLYDGSGAPLNRQPLTWARRPLPTIDDFPRQLMRMDDLDAHAVVSCTAEADGKLSGCTVVSESMTGKGIGRAAARIAGRGRLAGPVEPLPDGSQPLVRTTISFHVRNH